MIPIESIFQLNLITTVYNLRVADHHTYFVGGALWGWDVWVHNRNYAKRMGDRKDTMAQKFAANLSDGKDTNWGKLTP